MSLLARVAFLKSWLSEMRAPSAPTDHASIRGELDEALVRIEELEEQLQQVRSRANTLGKGQKLAKKQRDEARTQRDKAREQRDQARAQRKGGTGAGGAISEAMAVAQDRHLSHPKRHFRIGDHIETFLDGAEIRNGSILEIGGRENPYRARFDAFEYTNLDLGDTGPGVVVGDITNCPQVPDASFDVVLSVDVFEHINQPWLAAKEITRILKPGGLAYHSTLFSWRYHPCPIDYWRFTPACLQFLFSELECIDADFDDIERRRNIIGKGSSRIEPDGFGGWRENWRVFFAGRKPS